MDCSLSGSLGRAKVVAVAHFGASACHESGSCAESVPAPGTHHVRRWACRVGDCTARGPGAAQKCLGVKGVLGGRNKWVEHQLAEGHESCANDIGERERKRGMSERRCTDAVGTRQAKGLSEHERTIKDKGDDEATRDSHPK